MYETDIDTIKSVLDKYGNDSATGARVTLAGWVRTVRHSRDVGFMELNDGSCHRGIQVVFAPEAGGAQFATGSCVLVSGAVDYNEGQSAKNRVEIKAEKIKIIGPADADYPISKKRHSFEYLRGVAHLRPRTNTFSAVFRIRSVINYAIHEFLNGRGFVYVATPCITASDCEGAGESFRVTTLDMDALPKNEDGAVDYKKELLGKESFLTVSGQLHVEPFCAAFGKAYTFGPCFRAENSNTTRHACEFWHVEPEVAFADLNDIMDLIEEMTKYVIAEALAKCGEELGFLESFVENGLTKKLEDTVREPYARVTYAEALDILKKSGEKFSVPVEWGGFQTEWEKYLAEKAYNRPVFVTDYPKGSKPFYMRLNGDNATASATDLMFPGIGELVGASAREERPEVLFRRMEECGLAPEGYEWYADLRRYGTFPHAGFGMGVERMTRYITGMENIRDVIPYPRTPNNAEF